MQKLEAEKGTSCAFFSGAYFSLNYRRQLPSSLFFDNRVQYTDYEIELYGTDDRSKAGAYFKRFADKNAAGFVCSRIDDGPLASNDAVYGRAFY